MICLTIVPFWNPVIYLIYFRIWLFNGKIYFPRIAVLSIEVVKTSTSHKFNSADKRKILLPIEISEGPRNKDFNNILSLLTNARIYRINIFLLYKSARDDYFTSEW